MGIETVAIIGGGLIGQSWAALFLAHGLHVRVQDVAKGFEAGVRDAVARAWPDLQAVGMAKGDVPWDHLSFSTRIDAACEGADFIQECGPDRIEVKRQIVAQIEAGAAADVVIASSTSSLLASDIQAGAAHPERIVVAHPFNPPHLVPLVELVPGHKTGAAAMAAARAFYEKIGREVVELKRDVVGHVANRLSSALFREAVHIVAEGIASAEDVDRAVMHGPGLRWALMGPYLTYHLGGGAGGFRHYMEHLGPTQAARWKELGDPELGPATVARLIAGVDEMLEGMGDADPAARRDAGLVGLLALKRGLDGDDQP
ncbi:3-hydroxyacyl-CoA dehydrogenase NAD-binding domain-containing protein [Marimonas lutisalis]|uniref:3-hydroxyacyl-CoA dehydrogenase NAD-binding domain-containing protein n=1 Tax=Marimonas lutisalis TaxID=2545756 RepID=UPI001873C74A|nr:3-hydroxyacyl-CoA dehydrogenase NAD-binding domain-containing protein [Marimonas lutisalis]